MNQALLRQILHDMGRQINVPFMASGAFIVIVALSVALWLRSSYKGYGRLQKFNTADSGLCKAMVVLAVLYFIVYSYLSVHRYYKLLCGAWDLGIFDSLMYNALHGRFFQDYRGPFDHFQPALVLVLPFYALWQDARLLLVIQSAAVALAVWPLYLLARDVTGRKALAAVVGIMYLLYPLLGAGNLYDYHGISMTPLFFFSMLLFMWRRRWRPYWFFFALLCLTKESEAILAFGAGLYLMSRRQYKVGAATAAISVAWFFLSTNVLLPWTSGAAFRHFDRYQGLAGVATWAATTSVGINTAAAYAARVVAVFCFVMLPVGFVLFRRRWPLLLIFGPYFAVNMLSRAPYQNIFYGHYTLTLTAAVLGSAALALEGMRGLSRDEEPSILPLYLLVVACLSNLLLSWPANQRFIFPTVHLSLENSLNALSMPLPLTRYRRDFYRLDAYEHFFANVRGLFPKGSTIAAQNNLGYFFAVGYKLVDLKDDNRQAQADYYLFDLARADSVHTSRETFEFFLNRLSSDKNVVKFIDIKQGDGPGLVFYAAGDKWMDFYHNAVEAHRLDPTNPAFTAAIAEVERALGLPSTLKNQ